MNGKSGAAHRKSVTLQEVTADVMEVDSCLDALCDLLQLANGQPVESSGIRALLRPLQVKLSHVTDKLSGLAG
jgi:hypothetical protein